MINVCPDSLVVFVPDAVDVFKPIPAFQLLRNVYLILEAFKLSLNLSAQLFKV